MEPGDTADSHARSPAVAGDARDRNPTQQAIMEATHDALVTHGYADLTIQTIADNFPKSKSLLYYHYDTKADILTDFLGYLLDEFEALLSVDDQPSDPLAALEQVFDVLVPRTLDDEEYALRVAMVELQAQATHDARFRERYEELLAGVRETIRQIVAACVEAGAFRPVDPEVEATHLFSTLVGAILQQATVDPGAGAEVRDAVDDYVERALLA